MSLFKLFHIWNIFLTIYEVPEPHYCEIDVELRVSSVYFPKSKKLMLNLGLMLISVGVHLFENPKVKNL